MLKGGMHKLHLIASASFSVIWKRQEMKDDGYVTEASFCCVLA